MRLIPLIPCQELPADPDPVQEVECFLLSKKESCKFEWLKDEIDRWLDDLRKTNGRG